MQLLRHLFHAYRVLCASRTCYLRRLISKRPKRHNLVAHVADEHAASVVRYAAEFSPLPQSPAAPARSSHAARGRTASRTFRSTAPRCVCGRRAASGFCTTHARGRGRLKRPGSRASARRGAGGGSGQSPRST